MGRFFVGVLVAVLGIWGFDRLFGGANPEAAAHAGTSEDPGAGPFADPAGTAEDRKAPLVRDGGSSADPTKGAGDGVSKVPPAEASYADLVAESGPARDRLVGALRRRLSEATSTDARLALLGSSNAFLRTADGRAAALEIADWLAGQEPWLAVRGSTRLIESALNGPLGRDATDALATVATLGARHEILVRRTVFDPADLTGARRYVVKRGEVLTNIARSLSRSMDLKLQAGTLQLINRISNPNLIREGQALKVPIDPVRAVVFKSAFTVGVYVGDVLVRSYRCAHGKDGHETPEAEFRIGETVERPDWHYNGESIAFGDPRNPLGSHFVKFLHESYTEFGAHGTNEPETIGTRASLGCIRFGAADIVEFAAFMPRGAIVEVRR